MPDDFILCLIFLALNNMLMSVIMSSDSPARHFSYLEIRIFILFTLHTQNAIIPTAGISIGDPWQLPPAASSAAPVGAGPRRPLPRLTPRSQVCLGQVSVQAGPEGQGVSKPSSTIISLLQC